MKSVMHTDGKTGAQVGEAELPGSQILEKIARVDMLLYENASGNVFFFFAAPLYGTLFILFSPANEWKIKSMSSKGVQKRVLAFFGCLSSKSANRCNYCRESAFYSEIHNL